MRILHIVLFVALCGVQNSGACKSSSSHSRRPPPPTTTTAATTTTTATTTTAAAPSPCEGEFENSVRKKCIERFLCGITVLEKRYLTEEENFLHNTLLVNSWMIPSAVYAIPPVPIGLPEQICDMTVGVGCPESFRSLRSDVNVL